jgi:Bacterial Ig-like domain
MKKNNITKLIFIGILGLLLAAGCSGKNGSTGAAGATGNQGAQGQTGNEGPANPTVSWVMPVQGATDVYTDSVIKVGFSKPISSSTINASTFMVSTGGINVTGTVSYNSGSQTAFFDPYMPLAQFGFYTATLTTGIMDTAGNPITAAYTWTFLAGGSTTPLRLYISDWSNASISVFNNAGATNGNIFPDRIVSGGATLINSPGGIWLDKASDRLYVSNTNVSGILVFNSISTANGNIAPSRNITGAATTLGRPYGIWYDTNSDSLYAVDCSANAVFVFDNASTINGNVAPSRTISGSNTAFDCPEGIWLDSKSDQMYISNYYGSVVIFNNASTANGNIAPSRTIAGSTTTFSEPYALWLDSASDQLYVGDYGSSSILVFSNASTVNGDIAPARTLSGVNTTLNEPWNIWLDSANNRLYVANFAKASVLVFDSANTINGDVAPSRTIAGSNTGLSGPAAMWLDMNP